MAVEIKIPDVGESITEVFIGEWYVAEGDYVEADQDILGLETDKATFDVPAPSSGVISEILKSSGDSAEVGEVVGYLDESASPSETKESGGTKEKKKKKAKTQDEATESEKTGEREETSGKKGDRQTSKKREPERSGAERQSESRVMPAAARLLAERGLEADEVKATGPGGRLLKEDVQRHLENLPTPEGGIAPTELGDREERVVPMSPIRRTIAQRLVEAQRDAALLTTFNEIDMSAVKACRARYGDAFHKKYGVKLGFMSFFVKAVVDALNQYPALNAEIRGTDIAYRNYFDIGVAVGGGKGLVVPVLRNAERMSFAEIEKQIGELAQRAQQNKLSLSELEGGTFTITNGGVYGSLLSTPIVNPPQSGVLGMHGIVDRPVAIDGEVAIRPMMYVALTYDHRMVDGREAVTFLRRIKEVVEDPARMILEI